ncbi:MAG: PHP domain-containing protein [Clostridia bacterium]|nr:PHP domain-containing protein [Clostridia bacterium]
MEYKYELHAHTKEVSRCASLPVKEVIEEYKKAGYSGIVLTDHYSPMTFNPNEFFNKKKAIDHYLKAYREAKQYETEDFTVLLGMELRFYATVNDYIIYGITEEMLYELPFLLKTYIRRASRLLRERGCLFLQAHPFRKLITRANPDYLDGVEVFNGKASVEENESAAKWAEEINASVRTSGSDCHRHSSLGFGGIITQEPIKSNDDLIRILKNGNFKLIKEQKTS